MGNGGEPQMSVDGEGRGREGLARGEILSHPVLRAAVETNWFCFLLSQPMSGAAFRQEKELAGIAVALNETSDARLLGGRLAATASDGSDATLLLPSKAEARRVREY